MENKDMKIKEKFDTIHNTEEKNNRESNVERDEEKDEEKKAKIKKSEKKEPTESEELNSSSEFDENSSKTKESPYFKDHLEDNSQKSEIESKIEQDNTKLQDYILVIQRQQADFENYKKRVKRDQLDFEAHANQKLIEELLPIVDNLEKAIHSSSSNESIENYTALKEGILLIQKQLEQFLAKKGVKRIESVGKEFDPNLHEALQIDSSKKDYAVDTVIKEWQKGYCLHDRVIRHAKVLVAKASETISNDSNENQTESIRNHK